MVDTNGIILKSICESLDENYNTLINDYELKDVIISIFQGLVDYLKTSDNHSFIVKDKVSKNNSFLTEIMYTHNDDIETPNIEFIDLEDRKLTEFPESKLQEHLINFFRNKKIALSINSLYIEIIHLTMSIASDVCLNYADGMTINVLDLFDVWRIDKSHSIFKFAPGRLLKIYSKDDTSIQE